MSNHLDKSHLKVGDQAPDFEAKDENGKLRTLSDYKGEKLILYFYPRDNTPTCSVEAQNFRDHYHELKQKGFEVLGVSTDSEKKHQNFIKKFGLPFSLLVDDDHKISEAYGVWGDKQFMGKIITGILRTTFVIDENGTIEQVIEKVKSKEATEQILSVYNT